ncbi:MAG: hypothetical protein ACI84C_000619 [Flavobacteriales bacterium]|jgi:hypothetical protein
MKKINSRHFISLAIGVISIAVGLYSFFQGKEFVDYWLSLTMGVILVGTAYVESRKLKKEKVK